MAKTKRYLWETNDSTRSVQNFETYVGAGLIGLEYMRDKCFGRLL